MPRLRRTIIPRIKKSIAERGLLATLFRSVLLPIHLFREHRDARGAAQRHQPSEFDAAYGVVTDEGAGGRTYLSDLEIPSANWIYGVDYIAIEPERFRAMLSQLAIRFEEFTFIDFGSGKGRALLLAAEYPFRKIAGVEFSPELDSIAQQNVKNYLNPKQRCYAIESVCMDFSAYEPPGGPCVFYFYNPCEACVLAKTFENIRRSLEREPRAIYVLYVAPAHEEVVRVAGFLVQVASDPARNFCIYATRMT